MKEKKKNKLGYIKSFMYLCITKLENDNRTENKTKN